MADRAGAQAGPTADAEERIMSNRRRFTILDAIDDRNLFAPWFRDRATWASWFAFLRALFGLPLTSSELPLYRECTGRTEPPTAPATEGWLICGRRAGKSFMLALVAVYLPAFHQYRQYLAPGERGVILVIASDRKQARVIFRYVCRPSALVGQNGLIA